MPRRQSKEAIVRERSATHALETVDRFAAHPDAAAASRPGNIIPRVAGVGASGTAPAAGGAATEGGAAADGGGDSGMDMLGGYGGGDENEGAEPEPVQPQKKKKLQSRAERNERRHNACLELRPARMLALMVNLSSRKAHEARMLELDKEGRLALLAAAPCVACGELIFCSIAPGASSIHVRVFTLLGDYFIDVPAKKCISCLLEAVPDAEEAACFAAQAKKSRNRSLWFALDLLQCTDEYLFHGSAFKVAATVCGAGSQHLGHAWFEWKRASNMLRDLTRLGVTGVDTGPLGRNPSLADLDFSLGPAPLDDGPARDAYLSNRARLTINISLATDGTRTMDLLPKAGCASRDIAPTLTPYLSAARQAALEVAIADDKKLPRNEDDDGVATICGGAVRYTVARERATSNGKKQSEGLIGVLDEDGLPVLDGFLCQGPTHECFVVFDLNLIDILKKCPHVRFILVDHGCKYGPHLMARLPQDIRDRILVLVPWMHAELHILSCRLLHSGMYVDGIGYIVGEMSEQLWNQLKPFAKNIRYMTWANHIDFLNLGLQWIVKNKVDGLYKAS